MPDRQHHRRSGRVWFLIHIVGGFHDHASRYRPPLLRRPRQRRCPRRPLASRCAGQWTEAEQFPYYGGTWQGRKLFWTTSSSRLPATGKGFRPRRTSSSPRVTALFRWEPIRASSRKPDDHSRPLSPTSGRCAAKLARFDIHRHRQGARSGEGLMRVGHGFVSQQRDRKDFHETASRTDRPLGARSSRTIVLAFIDVDYRNQLEPKDIVAALAALKRCSDRSIGRYDSRIP